MATSPSALSAQDVADLQIVRSKLPQGDERIGKIDTLLKANVAQNNAQPSQIEQRQSAPQPGFLQRLGESLPIPHSFEEAGQMLTSLTPPIVPIAQRIGKNVGEGLQEEKEAAQNIYHGGPWMANIGKAGYGIMHGGIGSLPFVGQPMETAGEDVLKGNLPGAAGSMTGVGAQLAAPEIMEKGGKMVGAAREGLRDAAYKEYPTNGPQLTKGATRIGRAAGTVAGGGAGAATGIPGAGYAGGVAGFELGPSMVEKAVGTPELGSTRNPGPFSKLPSRMPKTTPTEEPSNLPWQQGSSGVRPSMTEERVTELLRKPVLMPDEAAELERALGPDWKIKRGEGIMSGQARQLGTVRARRAAQGMKEPQ